MGILYTKSIKLPPSAEDGMRICIMRKPEQGAKYDKWMPELSPEQTLRDKVKQGMNWEGFKPEFEKYLLTQQTPLDFVGNTAYKQNVTLLCIEDTPDRCHRSLVADAIKRKYSDLKIVVN